MMNRNEEKAKEFANHFAGETDYKESAAYSSAMAMAEWKDEQFAEENKWISVEDRLPRLVKTVFGIRRSKPVLCKTKSGGYCVARCFQYKNQPHFWEDDYYERPNVKFWKEING